MPESWRVRDFTGEGIYAGDEHRRHRHGTACAEIVYDVAPEAELYLLKVDDLVDLENAKDLCIREGIDVISHSAGWLGTGFGDGRGLACDIVNDAAENGILWVNAAGNATGSHYTGLWSDSDSDGWHNFADENDDELLNVQAAAGDSIQVILTWDDFPVTAEDYNLHLFFIDPSGNTELVDESISIQDGDGSDPVEWINYIVERSGEYGISVGKMDGALPKRLKVWSYNQDYEEHAVARNSIGMPADARGAMAVGAVFHRFWNRGLVEAYSSRGPTTDGRIKPELAAPTGVSTVSYGRLNLRQGQGYFGTSASAPHVAGAAALVKSANPSFSHTRLWNALIAAAVDLGTRGMDNDSGHGKLVLPVQSPSPQITLVSPSQPDGWGHFPGSSRPVLETALGDPFPTPFNFSVTVPFTTADPGQVRLSVFNLMGQQVRVLQDGWTEPGPGRTGLTGTGARQPGRKPPRVSTGPCSRPERSRNRPGWC